MNKCLKILASAALLFGSTGVKAQTETVAQEATTYSGYLTILMNDDLLALNQKSAIQITPTGDNKCTFLLPNLTLEGIGTIGDIELQDVNVSTDATGNTTYTKEPTDMKLLDGALDAKVSLDGTIDANGIANMTIPVIWILGDSETPLEVSFSTKPLGTEYDGSLNIFMFDDVIAADQPASIYILEVSDDECVFILPDLVLADLGGSLGDITLEGVHISEVNGVKTYTKDYTDMQLLGGELQAKVSLNGTIDADGVANMTIPVIWIANETSQIPLEVSFTGKQAAGISSVNKSDSDVVIYGTEGAVNVTNVNGKVRVYNTAGAKVAEAQVNGEASIAAPKGVAIVTTPSRAAKVIIK